MGIIHSDVAWEKYGEENPYYRVLTDDKFRGSNLTENAYNDFFKLGQEYVDGLFEDIHQFIGKDFYPNTALDFGCGTGRLVIPFSKRVKEITGVDVSEGMLTEAKKR